MIWGIAKSKKYILLKITFFYLLFGALWIFFSDKFLLSTIESAEAISRFQSYKGWLYVAVTGLIIYLLVRRYIFTILKSEEETKQKSEALIQKQKELKESNSRLKKAIQKIKQTQEKLIQQERMNALGQMASGIAHDFNNALTPILGFSEILLSGEEKLKDVEKVKFQLEMINKAAKSAADVVSRLREFYHYREDEKPLPVDINSLVKEAISLTRSKWKDQAQARGITIDIITELQDIPKITGYGKGLREAIINLILNAIDAMPEGGKIIFKTHKNSEKNILLKVSDTGIGMTEEVKQRCLEPFFSTKGERGTGLGLAVVQNTIQRHYGTIQIQSNPGKGTTIFLKLPIHKEARPKKEEEVIPPTTKLHILTADDDPLVLEVLTDFLTGDGHEVVRANSGQEALEKFKQENFNLVIVDRAMPDINGDKVASTIKKIAPGKPVIMLSGFGEMMKSSGEKPHGVDFVITKPVTLMVLRKTINLAMAGEEIPSG